MLLKSLKAQVPIEDNVHVKDKETESSGSLRALEAQKWWHPQVLQRRLNIYIYIF